MDETKTQTVIEFKEGKLSQQTQVLITEEPLSIRIEGQPYSVVMRTPGDEISHVAGFCLAEGLVDAPEDILTIGFCKENDTNVATVTLAPERRLKVADLLERKGFVSQTSCGICGKSVIEDLWQVISAMDVTTRITADQALACTEQLSTCQVIYEKTRSAHAAMLFDASFVALSSAEDVGRHNALDKAIGKVFMSGEINRAVAGVMSSRLSYELVQKAARARIEILIGISRPTAMAVELARSVNMTLVWARNHRLMVFCGEERFL